VASQDRDGSVCIPLTGPCTHRSLPLKTPLSHADFLAHLADVRRRIEYDGDAEAGGLGASMMSDVRSERSGLSSMRRGKRRK
jgi:hypothetical protein